MISKAMAREQDNGLTQKAALVSLFAGALALALAPILVKLSSLGPITTAWYRLTIALPFSLPGTYETCSWPNPGPTRPHAKHLIVRETGCLWSSPVCFLPRIWRFSICLSD